MMKELLKKEEAIEIIKSCTSEHDLSDSLLNYLIIHSSDEINVSGYFIIPTTDTPLLVPYGEVDPSLGYEQILHSQIRICDISDLVTIQNEISKKASLIEEIINYYGSGETK